MAIYGSAEKLEKITEIRYLQKPSNRLSGFLKYECPHDSTISLPCRVKFQFVKKSWKVSPLTRDPPMRIIGA